MTSPIPTRFSDEELALIDRLVDDGVGESRSSVIRHSVHHLIETIERERVGAVIAHSYRSLPQTTDDDEAALAAANALTEAEPW